MKIPLYRSEAMTKVQFLFHSDNSSLLLNKLGEFGHLHFINMNNPNEISNIKNDVISVGWGNTIANKGAVYISFLIGGKRMMFINCHLEAH